MNNLVFLHKVLDGREGLDGLKVLILRWPPWDSCLKVYD